MRWSACITMLATATLACNLKSVAGSPSMEGAQSLPAERSPTSPPARSLRTRAPFPDTPGAPRLFFTDLESGPNSGGQDDSGAFVTLYGEGFGSQQESSTVTLDGTEVARYVIWGENNALARGLDQIVVQIGPDVRSGDLVVTVGGVPSNPLPFTVRPGHIFFVSPSGLDTNDGSLDSPWGSTAFAKNSLAPGDTAYLLDGVVEAGEENYGAVLALENGGLTDAPMALVAYPGARPSIGSTGLEFGIRVPNTDATADNWVLAGLTLRGAVQAVDVGGRGSRNWRVVGNDISCPVGDGQTGCFAASLASDLAFLGNEVHDISSQGSQPSKQYHAVYFTTDTNHVEVGWNDLHDNRTCRAIQFHSSPLGQGTGFNQFDLTVHDNWIQGDSCDGINFATVDPTQGPVRAVNNIILHVGAGPHPPDGDSNYACIYVAGTTNAGPDGSGVVEIQNNTCFDFGSVDTAWSSAGAFARGPGSPGLVMDLRNNLVFALPGQPYVTPDSDLGRITGSHNLWFGNGAGPEFLQANLEGDPLFQDLAAFDFRLLPGSPAIDAGVEGGWGYDFVGLFRPQGSAYDVGAYEFTPSP